MLALASTYLYSCQDRQGLQSPRGPAQVAEVKPTLTGLDSIMRPFLIESVTFTSPSEAILVSAHKHIGQVNYKMIVQDERKIHIYIHSSGAANKELFGIALRHTEIALYLTANSLNEIYSRTGSYSERLINNGYTISDDSVTREAFAVLLGPKLKYFEARDYKSGIGDVSFLRRTTCYGGNNDPNPFKCAMRPAVEICASAIAVNFEE